MFINLGITPPFVGVIYLAGILIIIVLVIIILVRVIKLLNKKIKKD